MLQQQNTQFVSPSIQSPQTFYFSSNNILSPPASQECAASQYSVRSYLYLSVDVILCYADITQYNLLAHHMMNLHFRLCFSSSSTIFFCPILLPLLSSGLSPPCANYTPSFFLRSPILQMPFQLIMFSQNCYNLSSFSSSAVTNSLISSCRRSTLSSMTKSKGNLMNFSAILLSISFTCSTRVWSSSMRCACSIISTLIWFLILLRVFLCSSLMLTSSLKIFSSIFLSTLCSISLQIYYFLRFWYQGSREIQVILPGMGCSIAYLSLMRCRNLLISSRCSLSLSSLNVCFFSVYLWSKRLFSTASITVFSGTVSLSRLQAYSSFMQKEEKSSLSLRMLWSPMSMMLLVKLLSSLKNSSLESGPVMNSHDDISRLISSILPLAMRKSMSENISLIILISQSRRLRVWNHMISMSRLCSFIRFSISETIFRRLLSSMLKPKYSILRILRLVHSRRASARQPRKLFFMSVWRVAFSSSKQPQPKHFMQSSWMYSGCMGMAKLSTSLLKFLKREGSKKAESFYSFLTWISLSCIIIYYLRNILSSNLNNCSTVMTKMRETR